MTRVSHNKLFSRLHNDRRWNTLRKRQTYRKVGPIERWDAKPRASSQRPDELVSIIVQKTLRDPTVEALVVCLA
jgi:hypothetical protein